MKPILSILIPTLPFRSQYLNRLLNELHHQITNNKLNNDIEILIFLDEFEHTIGEKRNILCQKSNGKYVLYCDDDDMISSDFCKTIIDSLRYNSPDHLCFKQKEIDENGITKSVSEFSNKFSHYFKIIFGFNICDSKFCESNSLFVLRYKNSILYQFNKTILDILLLKTILRIIKIPIYKTYTSKTIPIKREIVLKYKFSNEPKNQDVDWVKELFQKKEIKTELHINKFLKYYYMNKKMSINRGSSQKLSNDERKKLLDYYNSKTSKIEIKEKNFKDIKLIYI